MNTNATSSIQQQPTPVSSNAGQPITLFLSGDVMTGRGIDQILPHPSDPRLYEPYMRSALGYVALAEDLNGPIPKPVDFDYIWGDALDEWERKAPDRRVINLETSITTSDTYWPDKGIHYRMHPENTPCLTAARIDLCALANNHVLDWGYAGLLETLESLERAQIHPAGAGRNLAEATSPAILEVSGKGRIVVFACGSVDSGIPPEWAAQPDRPGVNLLPDFSARTVGWIRQILTRVKQPGDVVVASIHWGGNWGYEIPPAHRAFAYGLIEEAGVDIIHGHSSHHVKGIEVYQDRLILYGAGDFLNDYEGISGYESFRGDLSLMYFAQVDPTTGRLLELEMTPMQMKRFQLRRASPPDTRWLYELLNREGRHLGTYVTLTNEDTLLLGWD